jgi:hypothetical protein
MKRVSGIIITPKTLHLLVGARGFEPPASWSRTSCSR